jgi:hypothetical protein
MKYLLSAQELTDLAKEVAAAMFIQTPTPMRENEADEVVRRVLADNGIKYEEGS